MRTPGVTQETSRELLCALLRSGVWGVTVNPINLEAGLRPNSAGIPFTVLLRIEAIGFPFTLLLRIEAIGFRTFGLLL